MSSDVDHGSREVRLRAFHPDEPYGDELRRNPCVGPRELLEPSRRAQ